MHNRLVTPALTEGSGPAQQVQGHQHSTVTGVPHLPDPGKGWEELIPSLLLNGTTRRLSSLRPSPTDKHNPPSSEDPCRLSPSPAACGHGAEDGQPKPCQAVPPALPCCSTYLSCRSLWRAPAECLQIHHGHLAHHPPAMGTQPRQAQPRLP